MSDIAGEPIESLYVHVPFCARKCSYCAFYSEPSTGDEINRYVAALTREMEWVAPDLRPRSIFFGGGTPSLLNLKQWESVLKTMHRLNLLPAAEFTVECNPATVSLDKARLLRERGVNRISMGVQSLDEDLLDRLGRVHSRAMVFKSWDILRQAGFDNLNLDLMFAIPGQTLEVWIRTLNEALALDSEHLSSYEVIYEEDTALYAQLKAGEVQEDEDLACLMFEELVSRAVSSGLEQYEVANFARPRWRNARPAPASVANVPAHACQHNVNYWRGGYFHGLGPGATGYVRGVRSRNWANTQLYCEQIEKGRRAFESTETLPSRRRAGETAAFGLRMVAGWPFNTFRQVTGYDLQEEWGAALTELVEQGWGEKNPEAFRLTAQGLRFADSAAQLFLGD